MQSHDGIKAMVLAAGVGSRLDPLTRQVPKPLVPFVNRPVMEYIMLLLKRHGITETISNVHYKPEMVPAHFGNGSELGMSIQYVHEPQLSGDAGGVRACKRFLQDGTFVVLMGDLITDMDLSYVINQHKERGAMATVALKQVNDVERFGIAVLDNEGYIRGFQEKPAPEQAKSNLASTGVYVLEPQIFEHIPQFGEVGFGKQLFPSLIEKGLPVLGVEVWGYWSDVGTIAQYRGSTWDALQGLIDLDLPAERAEFGWLGTGATVGKTLIEGAVLLGNNSHLADGVRVKGFAVVGDNCIVERGTFLENSIIWSGTVVGANSRLRSAVIGSNCYIEPGTVAYEKASVDPANPLDHELMQKRIAEARQNDTFEDGTTAVLDDNAFRADELNP